MYAYRCKCTRWPKNLAMFSLRLCLFHIISVEICITGTCRPTNKIIRPIKRKEIYEQCLAKKLMHMKFKCQKCWVLWDKVPTSWPNERLILGLSIVSTILQFEVKILTHKLQNNPMYEIVPYPFLFVSVSFLHTPNIQKV